MSDDGRIADLLEDAAFHESIAAHLADRADEYRRRAADATRVAEVFRAQAAALATPPSTDLTSPQEEQE